MEPVCDKCETDQKNYQMLMEGEKVYRLCRLCAQAFEELGRTNCINEFVTGLWDEKMGVNPILLNMIQSRQRRARGESSWKTLEAK